MPQKYRLRGGGLMRCCTGTLDELMFAATEPPKEGDAARCKWCRDEYGMVFRDGAWEWARPLEP